MAIRAAAREAWLQARSSREGEARDAMAATLTPFDVTTLTTADVDLTEGYTLFVFHDPTDDVHLAARSAAGSESWEILVVEGEPGEWTVTSAPIESLATLWEELPEPEPEPTTYPEWVQPTGAHDAYAGGDRVTWKSKVWESTVDGNVWEPGVSGWREVTA